MLCITNISKAALSYWILPNWYFIHGEGILALSYYNFKHEAPQLVLIWSLMYFYVSD